jgi:hypothetical protein
MIVSDNDPDQRRRAITITLLVLDDAHPCAR